MIIFKYPLKNRGIALPIVLGAVLCLGIWIGSLSYTMSQSRNRFQQMVKIRRAYFMARSALQHFFLKVKVFQRQCPQTMEALYKADKDQWSILSKSFIEDIGIPSEGTGSYLGKYKIANFTIESVSKETEHLALQITALGNVDGMGETIQRTYKVTR